MNMRYFVFFVLIESTITFAAEDPRPSVKVPPGIYECRDDKNSATRVDRQTVRMEDGRVISLELKLVEGVPSLIVPSVGDSRFPRTPVTLRPFQMLPVRHGKDTPEDPHVGFFLLGKAMFEDEEFALKASWGGSVKEKFEIFKPVLQYKNFEVPLICKHLPGSGSWE